LSDEPDGRGAVANRERTKVARERLQAKITRIMDQIRIEQASKEGLYTFLYINELCFFVCHFPVKYVS